MQEKFDKDTIKMKIEVAGGIVKTLTDVASRDDDITDEEIALIMNIKRNLDKYLYLIDKYDEMDLNTRSEEMHAIEKTIIQDATAKAFEDGKITNDEKQLLTKLSELMRSLSQSMS